jgi:hypothetical protein
VVLKVEGIEHEKDKMSHFWYGRGHPLIKIEKTWKNSPFLE